MASVADNFHLMRTAALRKARLRLVQAVRPHVFRVPWPAPCAAPPLYEPGLSLRDDLSRWVPGSLSPRASLSAPSRSAWAPCACSTTRAPSPPPAASSPARARPPPTRCAPTLVQRSSCFPSNTLCPSPLTPRLARPLSPQLAVSAYKDLLQILRTFTKQPPEEFLRHNPKLDSKGAGALCEARAHLKAHALRAIANSAVASAKAQAAAGAAGVLDRVLSVLGEYGEPANEIEAHVCEMALAVVSALGQLEENQERAQRVGVLDAVVAALRFLAGRKFPGALEEALRAVSVLSKDPANREALLAANGLTAIVAALNAVPHAGAKPAAGAIEDFAGLATTGARALAKLVASSTPTKEKAAAAGAIAALLEVIKAFEGSPEGPPVQAAAALALGTLVLRVPGNQAQAASLDAIQARALASPPSFLPPTRLPPSLLPVRSNNHNPKTLTKSNADHGEPPLLEQEGPGGSGARVLRPLVPLRDERGEPAPGGRDPRLPPGGGRAAGAPGRRRRAGEGPAGGAGVQLQVSRGQGEARRRRRDRAGRRGAVAVPQRPRGGRGRGGGAQRAHDGPLQPEPRRAPRGVHHHHRHPQARRRAARGEIPAPVSLSSRRTSGGCRARG